MNKLTLAFLLLPSLVLAGPKKDVDVLAFYAAAGAESGGPAILVSLAPISDGIVVNEHPAPRLALAGTQSLLVYEPPPKAKAGAVDPGQATYLDPEVPVRFPVKVASGAPKGDHLVKATVTYFYCSKREGWCRKGSEQVELTVKIE